jgi:hypothetical protein
MKYNNIPESESKTLLHSIGILLQQAAMYGVRHNVASLAMADAYDKLEGTILKYGAIEISRAGEELLVNKEAVPALEDTAAHNISNRTELHNIYGFLFTKNTTEEDFKTFINLLLSRASVLAKTGGFKAALEEAKIKSIGLLDSEYRLTNASDETERSIPAAGTTGAFSLDTESIRGISVGTDLSAGATDVSNLDDYLMTAKLKAKRKENTRKMASMLRATAALLENENQLPAGIGEKQILSSIERILKMVEVTSQETKNHISLLARKVEADRQTIASVESAARNRGIGFNLTRAELLEQYAEINQETLQPMTAAIGALEMLQPEKCENLSASQEELLKLAFESIQRVNQLLKYMNKISGLPESLTPDAGVIKDSYHS